MYIDVGLYLYLYFNVLDVYRQAVIRSIRRATGQT